MTLSELISSLEAERQEHGGDCAVQVLDLYYRKPSEPGYMRRIRFDAITPVQPAGLFLGIDN